MSQEKKAGVATLPPIEEPKAVKLTRLKDADGKLADAIPLAPVAGAGPVPRLIDSSERAPKGLLRFAIHCNCPANRPPTTWRGQEHTPKRYVLARTQDEAEAFYRRYASLESEELAAKALPD